MDCKPPNILDISSSQNNIEQVKQESNFEKKSNKNNIFSLSIKNLSVYILLNAIKKR